MQDGKKQNNPEYVRPGVWFFSFLRRKNNKEKQSTLIICFIFYRFKFFWPLFFKIFSLVVARVCCCEMAKSLLYITRPQVLHTQIWMSLTQQLLLLRLSNGPRIPLGCAYTMMHLSPHSRPRCVFSSLYFIWFYTRPPPIKWNWNFSCTFPLLYILHTNDTRDCYYIPFVYIDSCLMFQLEILKYKNPQQMKKRHFIFSFGILVKSPLARRSILFRNHGVVLYSTA